MRSIAESKKKTSLIFIIVVLLIAFSNVFAQSGAALSIHFNERCTMISLIGMLWFICKSKRMPSILNEKWLAFCTVSIAIMSILTILNYDSMALQLCNLVCTFGIVFWVQLFSKMNWENKDLFRLGVAVCVFAFLLNYQFLPGHLWAGWNSNSSITVIPIIFMGLACIWCSDHKLGHLLPIPIIGLFISIISTLDNRSALYTILIFSLIVILRKPVLEKKWYRVLYISVIVINVLTPYLNDIIASSDFFNDIIDISSVGKEKDGGFNGRESLWSYATLLIAKNPLFGLFGVRPIYPHNFSMDLLIEYGCIGWVTFYIMIVAVMEATFRENSKYNIFPVALICVIFLNTFENVFACCNMFVIFTYMLPSVALCIHRSSQYEANGYKLLKS